MSLAALAFWAFSLAGFIAGKRSAMRIAMIAMTVRSSMSVKPERVLEVRIEYYGNVKELRSQELRFAARALNFSHDIAPRFPGPRADAHGA